MTSSNEGETTPPTRSAAATAASSVVAAEKEEPARQYIRDRCYGKSKYETDKKPPCFMCYAPPPVYYCSPVLEQNRFCEFFGRIGVSEYHDEPDIRKRVFTFGLVANIFALIFTFYACFAISNNPYVLVATSFSKGKVTLNEVPSQVNVDVGLRAVAVTTDNNLFDPEVLQFGEFCDRFRYSLGNYTDHTDMHPDQCGDCNTQSTKLVSSIILSLLVLIPSVSSDVLRMHPNYDLNCQKFTGGIIALLSLFFSLYTFMLYNTNCFLSFYSGYTPFDINEDSIAAITNFSGFSNGTLSNQTVQVDMTWVAGNGIICMYIATTLKIVDIIANLIVPTPTITRDKEEQLQYERLYGTKMKAADDEDREAEGGEGNVDTETPNQ